MNPEKTEQQEVPKKSRVRSTTWPLSLAIILIGEVLLARNLGVDFYFLHLDNGWALFILVASVGLLYRKSTRLNSSHVKISYAVLNNTSYILTLHYALPIYESGKNRTTSSA